MHKLFNKLFPVILLVNVYLGIILMSSALAQVNKVTRSRSAYDRICNAQDMGEITLKESVFLRALLLYAPSFIPKDSKFAPRPGEALINEECLTGFFKDVHKVFSELSKQEKALLSALSPDLGAIIAAREKGE